MTNQVDHKNYSISTHQLNLWYGEFHALKSMNLKIKAGKITALIGPSGCGKTSLLRCFNRLNELNRYAKTTGIVQILGRDIYASSVSLTSLRRNVGMVFQSPNPLPMSIYSNILFSLRIHMRRGEFTRSQLDEMVESALREVWLWDDVKDQLNEPLGQLSLEQQQKLCIARLLPLCPQILLMDEPCSALDAEGREHIEDLLEKLSSRHTIILVTHDMGQVRRLSQETIFMLNGSVIEADTTFNMFHHPQRPETNLYISGDYGTRPSLISIS